MWSGNHHDHARVADEERSRAVHDGDGADPTAGEKLLSNPAHLGFRHLGVCLVVEALYRDTLVVVADPSDERRDRPVM